MKKKLPAVLTAFAAFGLMAASASTLGGVNSASVGADQTIVASCDSDGINMAYSNTYDSAANAYKTTAVTLSGVAAACEGKAFNIALSNGTAPVAEVTGTIRQSSGTQVVSLSAPVDSASIAKAALAITG